MLVTINADNLLCSVTYCSLYLANHALRYVYQGTRDLIGSNFLLICLLRSEVKRVPHKGLWFQMKYDSLQEMLHTNHAR